GRSRRHYPHPPCRLCARDQVGPAGPQPARARSAALSGLVAPDALCGAGRETNRRLSTTPGPAHHHPRCPDDQPPRRKAPGNHVVGCRQLQVLPFQCRIRVFPARVPPTAQALAAEVAAMPSRTPRPETGTRCQDVPFQRTMSGWMGLLPTVPAAQPSRAETMAMPDSWLPWSGPLPFGLGHFTFVQALPFQRSISVLWQPPAAQARRGDTGATADTPPPAAGLGVHVRVHVVPFQRRTRVLLVPQ